MKLPEIDDWLPELPPLDGDEEEADEEHDVVGEDLTVPGDSTEPADDSPDDSLEIGDCIEDEPCAAEGSDDEWEPDIGELDLVGDNETDEVPDNGEPSFSDDELDLEDGQEVAQDTGEEGPAEADDALLEEDLPPMDADAEGDFQDELLGELETSSLEALHGEARRSAPCAWQEVESLALPLPIGAGERDAHVLIETHAPHTAVVVTTRDGVRVSRGGLAEGRNWWRELARASRGTGCHGPFATVLAPRENGSTVWLACSDGTLFRSEDFGTTWEDAGVLPAPCRAGAVRCDGALVFLCTAAPELRLFVSDDGRSWFEQPLALASEPFREGTLWVAASGTALAVGHASGVRISWDGGRSFREVADTTGAIAGVFAGAEPQAPLMVALECDGSQTVLAGVERGAVAERAAGLGADSPSFVPEEDDDEEGLVATSEGTPAGEGVPQPVLRYDGAGEPLSLTWDSQREALWVWRRDVLTAWGIRSQH